MIRAVFSHALARSLWGQMPRRTGERLTYERQSPHCSRDVAGLRWRQPAALMSSLVASSSSKSGVGTCAVTVVLLASMAAISALVAFANTS
jgi:hypothetical protein